MSWYELTRQLEYKTVWNGRQYIKIDTFYASSQLCSNCGYQSVNTKDLSIREWICPICGAKHDRDINASIATWLVSLQKQRSGQFLYPLLLSVFSFFIPLKHITSLFHKAKFQTSQILHCSHCPSHSRSHTFQASSLSYSRRFPD